MCGLVGFVSEKFDQNDLIRAVQSLNHRGPDGSGIYSHKTIGLGHTRLSIIDLSENGHQPKISEDDLSVIAFNGEIYNYQNLAKPLNLDPNKFGDTHVLLEGLSKNGIRYVDSLNGMFAFAFFQKDSEELYLARDRVGIKPLFYFKDRDDLVFGSELKSIKAVLKGYASLTINTKAIQYFLRFGFIPAPWTIFNEIRKLEPGSFLRYKNGDIEIKKYWRLKKDINSIVYNEAVDRLDHLIEQSVIEHLVSDVPVGTFLSGGIDSGLVATMAQRSSGQTIKTFTIGFKEAKYDESVYAKEVAANLKTDHYEQILHVEEALSFVKNLVNIYDEPFGDSSALPTLLLTKYASQHVKVMLSGDGGDEVFLGYNRYLWAKRVETLDKWKLRDMFGLLLSRVSTAKFQRAATLLNHPLNVEELFSLTSLMFTSKDLQSVQRCDNKLQKLFDSSVSIEDQANFDLNFYLPDDNLTKVDRASMYNSLEVRVPLLDHRVVEFGNSLPTHYKAKKVQTKKILKEVLFRYLPKELYDRPKQGFSIPLSSWLKNDLRSWMEEVLDREIIEEQQVLNWDTVDAIKYRFLKGDEDSFNKLWLLTVLQDFLSKEIE